MKYIPLINLSVKQDPQLKKIFVGMVLPRLLFEAIQGQRLVTSHWACHGLHIANNEKLTEPAQCRHHLRNDPPNMNPAALENSCRVLGQVPVAKGFTLT